MTLNGNFNASSNNLSKNSIKTYKPRLTGEIDSLAISKVIDAM